MLVGSRQSALHLVTFLAHISDLAECLFSLAFYFVESLLVLLLECAQFALLLLFCLLLHLQLRLQVVDLICEMLGDYLFLINIELACDFPLDLSLKVLLKAGVLLL